MFQCFAIHPDYLHRSIFRPPKACLNRQIPSAYLRLHSAPKKSNMEALSTRFDSL
jgi:hypothetical protein